MLDYEEETAMKYKRNLGSCEIFKRIEVTARKTDIDPEIIKELKKAYLFIECEGMIAIKNEEDYYRMLRSEFG
jgi:hypothetical protein